MNNNVDQSKENSKTLTPVLTITGFVFIIIFCIGSIIIPGLLILRTGERLNYYIGTDVLGVFVCAVLYFGCMTDNRNTTRPFLLMIFIVATSFFAGIIFDFFFPSATDNVIDGSSSYMNVLLVAYINMAELLLVYCFWGYVRNTLSFKRKFVNICNVIAKVFLFVALLYVLLSSVFAFLEAFYNIPDIFTLSSKEEEVYESVWDFVDPSDLYIVYINVLTVICLIKHKAAIKYKVAVIVFMLIPLVHYIAPYFSILFLSDTTSQNGSRLISILIMYVFVFSEQSDQLNLKEQELDTGTEIQKAMLPSNFPYFINRNEFSIYASMNAAREVGGDFYDFYMLDDDHLAMVIGDVSGKGVPAALFMVSSKMTISNFAKSSKSPARILELANNEICKSNEHMLFISVWLGILEISTGVLTCANAGHEYPEICIAPGDFELYKDTHGVVMGVMPDAEFEDYEIKLTPNSKVFVYTDGVAEATNSKEELFGIDRLTQTLNTMKNESDEKLLRQVKEEVEAFETGVEQFDDVTMLCVTYNGVEEMATQAEITIEAEAEMLHEVQRFVRSHIEDIDCSEKMLVELDVIVEEIFINIASYAYAPFKGNVTVSADFDEDTECLTLCFVDSGRQYDPLAKEDPDINVSSQEREIGGLGIFMTKVYADDITYEFKDMKNILTIKKSLRQPQ